jgi:hypothetical protein
MPTSVFIPGFLRRFEAQGRPRLPALERLVARARRLPDAGSRDFLAQCFGLPVIPEAPFTRLADGAAPDGRYWLRADPVHLAPDRDQLVLMPGSMLQVTAEEAGALAAAFNGIYEDEGWRLEFLHPARGYLRCPSPLDAVTHDPAPLTGGPVLEAMPAGADAPRLKQLMNETQMLFHTHPVNRAREEAGRPLINSLWFWGGGTLPAKSGTVPSRVITDLPLLRGLGLWAAVETTGSGDPGTPDALLGFEGEDLLALERAYFTPLLTKLKAGTQSALDLYLGGLGVFDLDPAAARRFWKRGRPLGAVP